MKLSHSIGRSRMIAFLAALSLLGSRALAQEPPPKGAATPVTDAATATDLPADAKRAGQDVPVPTRKKYVAPEYPMDAAIAGIRGIVIMELLISESGTVSRARVTRSIPGLDEAAINAVKLWEYEPSKLAGKPVKVVMSQSITFALKLPDIQRSVGLPELKSGGAPSVPAGLTTPETASLIVTLGSQGEVREASPVEGNAALGDALLRAVKSWRFIVSAGATPPSFKVVADWTPGATVPLVLKALDLKSAALPSPAAAVGPATSPLQAVTPESKVSTEVIPSTTPSDPSPAPTATPSVATDTLPAREEPPAKEEGTSAISDVALGPNIPDLVRGRRPTWPPLARLGNITGDVTVRFSVDLAGKVTVHSAEGPDMLKEASEQAVATWLFRRTAIDRIHLIATFKFGGDRSMAKVERQP
ncbi:MAG: TonB family protein [Vicinamibacteria bacterium]